MKTNDVPKLTDAKPLDELCWAFLGSRYEEVPDAETMEKACRRECLKRLKRGHIGRAIHSGGSDPT